MFQIETDLSKYGRKVYSQNDEDGIIEYLVNRLEIKNGFFVEFGAGPPHKMRIEDVGLEVNCRMLWEKGWKGVFMDGSWYPEEFNVKNEYITVFNINQLLEKYQAPMDLDVMSIDVDGQDIWIWMNLYYRPKILVIEFNSDFNDGESKAVKFQTDFKWDGTRYMGASLTALCKVGQSKKYRPVYVNKANVFFVREDLIKNATDFPYQAKYPRRFNHRIDPEDKPWIEI